MSSGLQENLLPGIPFIKGDTQFPEQLASAMKGVDSIIHMAALKAAGESMTEPEKYAENNISGTINLLNAATAAKVKYFVFSSSAAVYGEPQYLPLDESHPTVPMNFYGHTKLAIENLLRWYSQLKGLRFSSLRYFNAAGYDVDGELNGLEHKPNNLLPIVLETIVGRREKVEVFGTDYDTRDGSCIRDYIHVSDLADAHLKALDYLKHENQDLVINLGTSKGLSVLEIIQIAREVTGQEFNYTLGPRRAGDPAVVLAKAELAAELLGWRPKHSDAHTLLETTLRAYRQRPES
jgi:UDP-glucose 4-epimerase